MDKAAVDPKSVKKGNSHACEKKRKKKEKKRLLVFLRIVRSNKKKKYLRERKRERFNMI